MAARYPDDDESPDRGNPPPKPPRLQRQPSESDATPPKQPRLSDEAGGPLKPPRLHLSPSASGTNYQRAQGPPSSPTWARVSSDLENSYGAPPPPLSVEDLTIVEGPATLVTSSEDQKMTLAELYLEPNSETYRIVLLGAERTGKTSFVNRFIRGEFDCGRYRPTRKECKTLARNYEIDNAYVDLHLYDFSPEHSHYTTVLYRNIQRSHGYIIFFDDTSRSSFEEIDTFATLIEENNARVSLTIVAIAVMSMPGRSKMVTHKEIKDWVKYWVKHKKGKCQFFHFDVATGWFTLEPIIKWVVRGIRENHMMAGVVPRPPTEQRMPKGLKKVFSCVMYTEDST